jgi:hypothetical protein
MPALVPGLHLRDINAQKKFDNTEQIPVKTGKGTPIAACKTVHSKFLKVGKN